MNATATARHTEASMLDALHRRYTVVSQGAGERYVRANHVRCRAGFDARRTADFVAVDLWESSGLAIHGHEIKVSRGDWLRELKEPEKAGTFTGSDPFAMDAPPLCDFWWLAVTDLAIVKPEELPPRWGLLVMGAGGLRLRRGAERLTPMPTWRASTSMSKSFAVSLMRAVSKTYARTEIDQQQQEEQAQQDVAP